MRMKSTLIVLGVVAALVAIVIAAGQIEGGGPKRSVETPDQTPKDVSVLLSDRAGAPDSLPPEADSASVGSDASSTYGEQVTPPLPDIVARKLVRDATVSLGVEDVMAAVRQVGTIASGAGGFVSASNVFVEQPPQPVDGEPPPPQPTQSASITIRVPADAYDNVLAQLDGIGKFDSQSSTTSDVTEEFTDLEARLRNLEATEARYLELLQKATTIPDILSLQDRINAVRLEIERVQGRMNLLNDLTEMATIVVQLRPAGAVEPSEPGWAQQAWEDAWQRSQDTMEAMGTVAIVGGVVLAWLAVPALALALGWRLLRPRRPSSGEA